MSELDIRRILEYLPHRYPLLLIDRVLECSPGERIVAVKNVTFNEPHFQGHFPDQPVMPGVLIVEAMAQATGVMGLSSLELPLPENSMYYIVGVDGARFRKPVRPGDQLIITVELMRKSRGIWKVAAKATVDGQMVAEANLMAALRDAPA